MKMTKKDNRQIAQLCTLLSHAANTGRHEGCPGNPVFTYATPPILDLAAVCLSEWAGIGENRSEDDLLEMIGDVLSFTLSMYGAHEAEGERLENIRAATNALQHLLPPGKRSDYLSILREAQSLPEAEAAALVEAYLRPKS